MKKVVYVADSWKGYDRDANKDDHFVYQSGTEAFFIVFDGVSSTANARTLIDSAKEYINSAIKDTGHVPDPTKLFFDTNTHLLEKHIDDAASTYVAIHADYKTGDIKTSSLGDSRIYKIEENSEVLLTKDDALPNEPHVVTKGLGFENMMQSDFYARQLDARNGRFLLCTDGFYEFLENKEKFMRRALHFRRLGNSANAFKKIVDGKNADDATFLLLDIK